MIEIVWQDFLIGFACGVSILALAAWTSAAWGQKRNPKKSLWSPGIHLDLERLHKEGERIKKLCDEMKNRPSKLFTPNEHRSITEKLHQIACGIRDNIPEGAAGPLIPIGYYLSWNEGGFTVTHEESGIAYFQPAPDPPTGNEGTF